LDCFYFFRKDLNEIVFDKFINKEQLSDYLTENNEKREFIIGAYIRVYDEKS